MKTPDIFAQHPGVDVLYKASDGNFFFTKNTADNHAKTLKNGSVEKVVNRRLLDVELQEDTAETLPKAISTMNKAELKQALDHLEIQYSESATNAQLASLLSDARKSVQIEIQQDNTSQANEA